MKQLLLCSVLLLTACGQAAVETDSSMTQRVTMQAPAGAKDLPFVAPLNGVNDVIANGVTSLRVSETTTTINVDLNIAPPEGSKQYAAYLVTDQGRISLGMLTAKTSDVRHSLKFQAAQIYENPTRILILLQSGSTPAAGDQTVAEAIFPRKTQ